MVIFVKLWFALDLSQRETNKAVRKNAHQPSLYQEDQYEQKNSMTYFENQDSNKRQKWKKFTKLNKGVRVSGRRFTTGSYYRNKNEPTKQFNTPGILKCPEIRSGSPEKLQLDSPLKPKAYSSNTNKRQGGYPSNEQFESTAPSKYNQETPTYSSNLSMMQKTKIIAKNANNLQQNVNQSGQVQYLKSASLCQFHKKIFILTDASMLPKSTQNTNETKSKLSKNRILSKNPNWNHNNNLFYQPMGSNVAVSFYL